VCCKSAAGCSDGFVEALPRLSKITVGRTVTSEFSGDCHAVQQKQQTHRTDWMPALSLHSARTLSPVEQGAWAHYRASLNPASKRLRGLIEERKP